MKRNNLIYSICLLALMIAIMILMGFTPLGTIQIGALTCTLIGVPLTICASIFGPLMGGLLGLVWGIISLIQGVTGIDAMGPVLMEYSLFGLIFTCLVPRILVGIIVGFVGKGLDKVEKKGYLNSYICAAVTPILNTALFMTSYCLFFFNAPEVQNVVHSLASQYGFDPANPFLFVVFLVGINFFVEMAADIILGGSCSVVIREIAKKMNLTFSLRSNNTVKSNKLEKSIESSNE